MYFDFEYAPHTPFVIIEIILFIIPLSLGIIFQLIFKKGSKPNRLQWLPISLNIVFGIFWLVCFFSLRYVETNKVEHERDLIIHKVQNWIDDNAKYPESYKSLHFGSFRQRTQKPININYCPTRTDEKLLRAIYFSKKEEDKKLVQNMKSGCYLIEHKFLLKNKKGKADTVNAIFQLSPDLEITNVRLDDELNSPPHISFYKWRNLYGIRKKNLELEVNGFTNKDYSYVVYDLDDREVSIYNFRNCLIEGQAYRIDNFGDTMTIVQYKYGFRNGLTIERCTKTHKHAFSGNLFGGKFYGKCTWYYCNGNVREEGYKINDQTVGIWKNYDSLGVVNLIQDFHHQDRIDSFLN